jgi:hypothetical protein
MAIYKTYEKSGPGGGLDFILSDATVRFGDILQPSGWVLRDFLRNPIARAFLRETE